MQSAFIGRWGGHRFAANPLGYRVQGLRAPPRRSPRFRKPFTMPFRIGAIVFLVAILWDRFYNQRVSPLRGRQRTSTGRKRWLVSQTSSTQSKNIPGRMKALAVVQFFYWIGLFCFLDLLYPCYCARCSRCERTNSPLYAAGKKNIAKRVFRCLQLCRILSSNRISRVDQIRLCQVDSCGQLAPRRIGLVVASVDFDRKSRTSVNESTCFPLLDAIRRLRGCGKSLGPPFCRCLMRCSQAVCFAPHGSLYGDIQFLHRDSANSGGDHPQRIFENVESFNRLHAVVVGGLCMLVAAGITACIRYKTDSTPAATSIA